MPSTIRLTAFPVFSSKKWSLFWCIKILRKNNKHLLAVQDLETVASLVVVATENISLSNIKLIDKQKVQS